MKVWRAIEGIWSEKREIVGALFPLLCLIVRIDKILIGGRRQQGW